MTTPAGWYEDPHDSSAERYWDGQDWTPHRQRKQNSGVTQPPAAPATAYVAPASYQQQPQAAAPANYPQPQQPPPPSFMPAQAPAVALGAQQQKLPNSHLVWAVFSIFFCLPFGVLAIINATKVSNLWALGQYDAAYDAAKSAKNFAIWATIAWAVWFGIVCIFILLPMLFGMAAIGTGLSTNPNP